MKGNLIVKLTTFTILLVLSSSVFAQGSNNASTKVSDSLAKELGELRDLLIKQYRPMIPIANRRPSIDAKFQPAQFNTCHLKWKLIAGLGQRSSYVLDIAMNLADLDPVNVRISKDLGREDRWFVELQVVKHVPKIKVRRSMMNGRKVTFLGSFLSPQAGFDAGEEAIHSIADAFRSTIKQCSQTN